MSFKASFLHFIICLFFVSCGPKVSRQIYLVNKPLDYTDNVSILQIGETPNGVFKEVGFLRINDNGFTTKCSYGEIMNRAKNEALRAGANTIQITEVKRPNALTSCFRLEAKMLNVELNE